MTIKIDIIIRNIKNWTWLSLNIDKKSPLRVCKYKMKDSEPKIINIPIVNSIFILLYFPIDMSDVENPPVASVVIEWAIESKVGIPNIQRSKAQSIVKT